MRKFLLLVLFLVSCAAPDVRLSVNADPRATWLKVTNANTYPRYEVTNIGYQDETQSGGNVNIYVQVLDELGRPSFGTRVRFNTTDGQNEALQTIINGSTDFPMSGDSSFSPDRGESGPYYVEMFGVPSDRVTGMGLPLRRHVVYQIRFQKILSGSITPVPITPSPITPIPGGLTEERVKQLINQALQNGQFK